jgi:DNA-binding transcriptional MerR regulator
MMRFPPVVGTVNGHKARLSPKGRVNGIEETMRKGTGTSRDEGLLSIGEVSRMKGVGVKALRHYERIGILTPAYVNPATGYRYYSMGQMPTVDVIVVCVDLGIPLARVRECQRSDGSLDAERLFSSSLAPARERIRKAQLALESLEACEAHVEHEAHARDATAPYRQEIEGTWLIATAWSCDEFDARRYAAAVTLLTQFARDHGLAPLARQGIVSNATMTAGTARMGTGWSVVLEATGLPGERHQSLLGRRGQEVLLLRLPARTYEARRVRAATLGRCFSAALAQVQDRVDEPTLVLESWGFGNGTQESCCEVLTEAR